MCSASEIFYRIDRGFQNCSKTTSDFDVFSSTKLIVLFEIYKINISRGHAVHEVGRFWVSEFLNFFVFN